MSIVSHLHHLFNPETCQSYIHRLRWKDRPLQCPRCQSHNVGPWGASTTSPDCHATAVKSGTASAPSMTSRERSWMAASALSCIGFLRRFSCACRVPLAAWPKNWGGICGRANAGVGGCAMPPCPTRWSGSSKAPWKRMNSITPLARRGKRNRGKNYIPPNAVVHT